MSATQSHAGRFVWRELTTPDPAAAAAFYGAAFGWTAESANMGMPYTMLRQPGVEAAVGGAMAPQMEGVPPHWLDYITVDDLEASVARVPELGGTLLTEIMTVPGTGRFAVVRDPLGGVFALFVGENPGATETPARPPAGTFCWSQLMSSNLDVSVPFYTALFGWTSAPMGDAMVVFNTADGVSRATAKAIPEGSPQPTAWLQYIAVDDAKASFATATGSGATTIAPPATMPGMGEFAVLADPTGAVFAIWKDLQARA